MKAFRNLTIGAGIFNLASILLILAGSRGGESSVAQLQELERTLKESGDNNITIEYRTPEITALIRPLPTGEGITCIIETRANPQQRFADITQEELVYNEHNVLSLVQTTFPSSFEGFLQCMQTLRTLSNSVETNIYTRIPVDSARRLQDIKITNSSGEYELHLALSTHGFNKTSINASISYWNPNTSSENNTLVDPLGFSIGFYLDWEAEQAELNIGGNTVLSEVPFSQLQSISAESIRGLFRENPSFRPNETVLVDAHYHEFAEHIIQVGSILEQPLYLEEINDMVREFGH